MKSFRALSILDRNKFKEPYFSNKEFHFTKIEGWTGVGLPKFKTIAFEGAKITGILQEIDIEMVQLIASAYKQIYFNQDFGKSLFDKMIQMDSSTSTIDAIGMIELLTTDILGSENRLKERLQEIIKQLQNLKS